MNKEELIIKLVENIMIFFKDELLTIIDEEKEKVPIFNSVLDLMSHMNKYTYSYTLRDIDDKLFDKLIYEIKNVIFTKVTAIIKL